MISSYPPHSLSRNDGRRLFLCPPDIPSTSPRDDLHVPSLTHEPTPSLTNSHSILFYSILLPSRHPLGRPMTTSTYPGLPLLAALAHWVLSWPCSDLSLHTVCVYLGPTVAGVAVWGVYGVVTEVIPGGRGRRAGLMAALLLAFTPSYISRRFVR